MKRQFLLSALLAFGYLASYAQSPKADAASRSVTFEINPVDADVTLRPIKFGRQFKFRISNVNSLGLEGYTTAKPFNFEVAAPALFSEVKIPTGAPEAEKKKPTGPEKAVMGWSAIPKFDDTALTSKYDSLKKAYDEYVNNDFLKNYNAFIANYLTLQKMAVAEDSLFKMLPNIVVPDTLLMKNNAKAYITSVYKLNGAKNYIDEVSYVQQQFTESYYRVKKAYQELNAFAVDKSSSMTGQFKTKGLTIDVSKANVTITQTLKFELEFNTATKIFNNLNDDGNATKLFNKAAKGILLYNKIMASKFEVYTDAIQINEDELEVKPALKDKAGKIVKEFNAVTVKATGGLKVNFSTGYLLSFIGNENYTQGMVDGKPGLINQQKNDLTSAIGALANIYPRTASGLSIGVSSGFSMTATGNIGFYLGGSGLFLEKNRLAFTAGLSYVKVDRLNTANLTKGSSANTYTFSSSDITPHYDSLYKPGFFFGITYNIFSGGDTKAAK